MKYLLLLLCTLCGIAAYAKISIIPEPVSVIEEKGTFTWNGQTTVFVVTSNKDVLETSSFFIKHINIVTGSNISAINTASKSANFISISLNKTPDNTIGNEGYTLSVKPTGITLTANTPAGIFYGWQTLMQLLPPAAAGDKFVSKTISVPCVTITDYPRFGWRGLMLDVSRHFFTKEEVKLYIDQMAKYKYNTFHWHLSDDNGWRIEIKSLPKLTSIGAWRVPRTGLWGNLPKPQPGEAATDGGFYTQEDTKEIIKYAQDRYITILPEIDIPAHSLAMIAAYPNLSCTQLQYPVNPGSKFYTIEDNVLCPANDSVYQVLDKVFTEIAALFPGQYIHIGGDEAYKVFWKTCPRCQKLMTAEHLKTEEELQSYFVKKIEKILLSKNKKMIGWDEILEGGLAPEATVMSWRGMKGGIEAAKMNHHVVMSPWDFCYLDLYQGEPAGEPNTYGMSRMSAEYNYDPVPEGVDAKYILGGQGNLWAESVANIRHAQYMTWPRSLALAEVYWSPKSKRNWSDFITRMEANFPRMDAAGIKYARSVYNPIVTPAKANNADSLQLTLSTEIKELDIYYTFDNTNPDSYYPKYKGETLTFPNGASQINIITYRNGKPIGQQVNVKKEDLIKRLEE